MSQPQNFLTTQAFAKIAGVSAATVSKWLRNGTIDGRKKNGKWFIAEKEKSKVAASEKNRTQAAKSEPAPKAAGRTDGATYSVEAFSARTYLTEFGVKLWLKTGRLTGTRDDAGRPGVAAASLDHPHIKRLLR